MREGLTENRRKAGMSPAVWDQSQGVRIVMNASVQTDRQPGTPPCVDGWCLLSDAREEGTPRAQSLVFTSHTNKWDQPLGWQIPGPERGKQKADLVSHGSKK